MSLGGVDRVSLVNRSEIQTDGKIVLAGSAGAVTARFALARYLG